MFNKKHKNRTSFDDFVEICEAQKKKELENAVERAKKQYFNLFGSETRSIGNVVQVEITEAFVLVTTVNATIAFPIGIEFETFETNAPVVHGATVFKPLNTEHKIEEILVWKS